MEYLIPVNAETKNHTEDIHVNADNNPNRSDTVYSFHPDGPDADTGIKNNVIRSFHQDKLYVSSPGYWCVKHLRDKLGNILFEELDTKMFLTGIANSI